MEMNFTETEIQQHLWERREQWHELLLPFDPPKTDLPSDPEQLNVGAVLKSLVFRKLKRLYDLVYCLELFGVEVPLDKEGDATIRADFLGHSPGSPGVAIIELKRSRQTEREAFTELLAYSGHINNIFPTHCTDDNLLVLIAPMEVRTVREAYLQSLLFDQKSVFALTPVFEDPSRIESIQLRPFIPSTEDIITLSEVAFAKRNFDVHVQVWQDAPEFWNPSKEERDPNKYQRENMNRVSSHAAQLMEARRVHGFVYTQQSWPELGFPYPNSLVIAGFNPY